MQVCVSLLTALHARSRKVASEGSGADVSVFPDCVSHQCKVHLRVGVQACVSLLTALHARSRKVASEGSQAVSRRFIKKSWPRSVWRGAVVVVELL